MAQSPSWFGFADELKRVIIVVGTHVDIVVYCGLVVEIPTSLRNV